MERNERVDMQSATKNDLEKLKGELLSKFDSKLDLFHQEFRQFAVVQENRYEDLLGMYGDVVEYIKEIPGLKRVKARHDMEIKHLNRKVFGYDSVVKED